MGRNVGSGPVRSRRGARGRSRGAEVRWAAPRRGRSAEKWRALGSRPRGTAPPSRSDGAPVGRSVDRRPRRPRNFRPAFGARTLVSAGLGCQAALEPAAPSRASERRGSPRAEHWAQGPRGRASPRNPPKPTPPTISLRPPGSFHLCCFALVAYAPRTSRQPHPPRDGSCSGGGACSVRTAGRRTPNRRPHA